MIGEPEMPSKDDIFHAALLLPQVWFGHALRFFRPRMVFDWYEDAFLPIKN